MWMLQQCTVCEEAKNRFDYGNAFELYPFSKQIWIDRLIDIVDG